jgi:hypothetical protein
MREPCELIRKCRFLNQSKGAIRGLGHLDAAARTGGSQNETVQVTFGLAAHKLDTGHRGKTPPGPIASVIHDHSR